MFCCFFHNIFLKNKEELLVKSNEDLEEYNEKDRERISSHTLLASELLEKDPNISLDVITNN
jgi:hypothetical protein